MLTKYRPICTAVLTHTSYLYQTHDADACLHIVHQITLKHPISQKQQLKFYNKIIDSTNRRCIYQENGKFQIYFEGQLLQIVLNPRYKFALLYEKNTSQIINQLIIILTNNYIQKLITCKHLLFSYQGQYCVYDCNWEDILLPDCNEKDEQISIQQLIIFLNNIITCHQICQFISKTRQKHFIPVQYKDKKMNELQQFLKQVYDNPGQYSLTSIVNYIKFLESKLNHSSSHHSFYDQTQSVLMDASHNMHYSTQNSFKAKKTAPKIDFSRTSSAIFLKRKGSLTRSSSESSFYKSRGRSYKKITLNKQPNSVLFKKNKSKCNFQQTCKNQYLSLMGFKNATNKIDKNNIEKNSIEKNSIDKNNNDKNSIKENIKQSKRPRKINLSGGLTVPVNSFINNKSSMLTDILEVQNQVYSQLFKNKSSQINQFKNSYQKKIIQQDDKIKQYKQINFSKNQYQQRNEVIQNNVDKKYLNKKIIKNAPIKQKQIKQSKPFKDQMNELQQINLINKTQQLQKQRQKNQKQIIRQKQQKQNRKQPILTHDKKQSKSLQSSQRASPLRHYFPPAIQAQHAVLLTKILQLRRGLIKVIRHKVSLISFILNWNYYRTLLQYQNDKSDKYAPILVNLNKMQLKIAQKDNPVQAFPLQPLYQYCEQIQLHEKHFLHSNNTSKPLTKTFSQRLSILKDAMVASKHILTEYLNDLQQYLRERKIELINQNPQKFKDLLLLMHMLGISIVYLCKRTALYYCFSAFNLQKAKQIECINPKTRTIEQRINASELTAINVNEEGKRIKQMIEINQQ